MMDSENEHTSEKSSKFVTRWCTQYTMYSNITHGKSYDYVALQRESVLKLAQLDNTQACVPGIHGA